MNLSKPPSPETKPEQQEGLVEWFMDEFWPRFGKQAVIAVLAVLIVASAVYFFNQSRRNQQAAENKELGQVYVYLEKDKADSAEAFLTAFLKESHSRLVGDKANLLLGNILYGKGKYDEAIKAYEKVDLASTRDALLSSGALHGIAASHIQKKEYDKAAPLLETFVQRFMRKTGAPDEKVEGGEVADLSPAVPNALWKLILCQRELNQPDKAKASAEKLLKIYPESKEAFDATRLLAQLP